MTIEKNVPLNCRITFDQSVLLRKVAEERDVDISVIVRDAIDNHVYDIDRLEAEAKCFKRKYKKKMKQINQFKANLEQKTTKKEQKEAQKEADFILKSGHPGMNVAGWINRTNQYNERFNKKLRVGSYMDLVKSTKMKEKQ